MWIQNFVKNMLIGFLFGSQVYRRLSETPSGWRNVYEKGPSAVTVVRFKKYALEMTNCCVLDSRQKLRNMWTVPAPFCTKKFMNVVWALKHKNMLYYLKNK